MRIITALSVTQVNAMKLLAGLPDGKPPRACHWRATFAGLRRRNLIDDEYALTALGRASLDAAIIREQARQLIREHARQFDTAGR